MSLLSLGEALSRMDGGTRIEFMRFVATSVGTEEKERNLIETAARKGAEIAAKTMRHQPLDVDDVKEYNEAVKKAFPETQEGAKEDSQEDKPDN